MPNFEDFSIIIGGKAGQGTRKAGKVLAEVLTKLSYNIYIYDDYPSLIKGGHNYSQIRASFEKVASSKDKVDFLISLDEQTTKLHEKDLSKGGVLVCNETTVNTKEIIKENGGIPIMESLALVSAFCKLIGIDWEILEEVIKSEFAKSTELSLKIAKNSYDDTEKQFDLPHEKTTKDTITVTGNEALSLGAVKAGLTHYFAYPMTPSTGILHYLAKIGKENGLKAIQLENEVGVINTALGASYAGAKTMIGTSGGGFALMGEGVSLAVESEIPLVIVNSQRMGPATGVPTYNAQADLNFALNIGHGDLVKFTIAPGNAEQTCLWTAKALELAWKYQTPVVILVDKEISEATFSFDKKTLEKIDKVTPQEYSGKGKYNRYEQTENGISPLAFPGTKGVVVKANSYEHNEYGITTEDSKLVEEMHNKRLGKFKEMAKEVEDLESVEISGNEKAEKAIIAWGSTSGVAREVAENLDLKMIQPIVLEPFPEKQMKKALARVKEITVVETNSTGQLAGVLQRHGINVDHKILKYDGRLFYVEELEKRLEDFTKGKM